MKRIGILGGTFNPIHSAHIMLAETAGERLQLDRVLIMPSNNPPHKANAAIASDEDRSEMVRLAIKGHERLEYSDFEMKREGITYTSDTLNMLTSLPIDALKLDMHFIRNICGNQKDCRLVGIMIDIARLLNVPVIAEGVETKEQMELLKELGCDIIQGYYFSKPLSAEDFSALIRAEIGVGDHDDC